ncbi:hypothetical protein [uncultured Alistipes sp.]|jgi:hypothetical protein|uniref:hypothetical protein n=1 Tax=Alistipes sp. TaxID=1872444 RepID=UPI0025D3A3A2|nr:hypothetical protein [uncultured Alistipes sp.]
MKVVLKLCLLLVFIFGNGCGHTNVDERIKKFMSSNLLVADTNVRELIDVEFEKYNYCFISYIDPYECVSCYMNRIVRIHEHPVMKDNSIGQIIIISADSNPEQIEMVRAYCENEIRSLVDAGNAIYDANPALAISACRTFMITRDYKVRWVGNPLISKETVRLFMEGINCLKIN